MMEGISLRLVLFFFCTILLSHCAQAELQGRCPADEVSCPPRATPCGEDSQCDGEQICCSTQCGKACIDPLFTGCENVKLSTERISRALSAENSRRGRGRSSGVRTPRCRTSDGEFEEIQCDNEIVSSCWCVDATGFELAGTRAPAASLVNCQGAVAKCAAHTCRMLCPLGFELDSRGCPLCKCRDPCSTVTCPGQLSCQLEERPCLRPPCPPVPTCKRGRSLQNICPAGEPLLITETNRPFLCGTDPGKPNCPPLYRCLVESGNDYGVCCPASLELRKAGTCPAPSSSVEGCGTPCAHDLECPSMQKCCDGGECGRHCTLPHNVTACTQQKMLAELLVVSEKEGRGYVPQCANNGSFESRQCSRNGLVCWCVDTEGNKLRGSMGPQETVKCSAVAAPARVGGRSLDNMCTKALCAGVCEYGYNTGLDGCPTCECDDPCEGFPCSDEEECVRVKEADCSGELCTGYPICRPKVSYENPCESGTPATDEAGSLRGCGADDDCPDSHSCTRAKTSGITVCCPLLDDADNSTISDIEMIEMNLDTCGFEVEALCGLNSTRSCADGNCEEGFVCCNSVTCGPLCVDPAKMRLQTDRMDDTPSMCEYLRDFDEKMEGTVDGMRLALPAPQCMADGSFTPRQCAGSRCWCVDSFGTEIPKTSTTNGTDLDCLKIREEIPCLDLTCRLGCDYGFEMGSDRCPTCRCRDPCSGVTCPDGRACAVVDVACDADYCPHVPACLPKKPGQCPYLVPSNGACEWACRSDADCGSDSRCCATGCGTACAKAIHQSACQQRRALALHTAAETGQPPAASWIPTCTSDGEYEKIQCRASDRVCWCVDAAGNEMSGTRATNSIPVCEKPSSCAPALCEDAIVCPYGAKLDEQGCPTCHCRDPCADANCRADETCELVSLECAGEYCPPVGRCAPASVCPDGGSPLQAPDGSGVLPCGPTAASCPSSHACRFAPHDARPPVCCPKPRTVCFEARDEGLCSEGDGFNATRWHFNHQKNRCEKFTYHGCSGNHNNFKNKDECNAVCPVLSPCERLREKNELAAEKYGKSTFIPVCDASGAWEPVQCMQHIDVCWCVSGRGEPLKGSLLRGAKPTCNFRQARKWITRDPLDDKSKADEVLEELIRQMTAYRIDEFDDGDEDMDSVELRAGVREVDNTTQHELAEQNIVNNITKVTSDTINRNMTEKATYSKATAAKIQFKTKCQLLQIEVENGAEGLRPRCLADGSFSPRQCNRGRCWCVDGAGQKRSHPNKIPDLPEADPCELIPVDSATLELELVGVDKEVAESSRTALSRRLAILGSRVPVIMTRDRSVVQLRATLPGPRGADIVYQIENWVKQEKLTGLETNGGGVLHADVIRSEYRLATPIPAMQQREILTASTMSATTSYHTALIVLAATSAFIISVLCVLVMLYRARLQREPHKAERFLPAPPPVYVLSADEKAELARALHAPPAPVPPQNLASNNDNSRI